MTPDKNKILLLQYRENKQSRDHERVCFMEMFDKPAEDFIFIDTVEGETPETIDPSIGAVVLGGSGDFYISKGYWETPEAKQTQALLDKAIAADLPIFGICFGFQLLGKYFGAEVIRKDDAKEFGGYEVSRLESGHEDPLISQLPLKFGGNLGHHDVVVDFPEYLTPLARSERVEVQAFRYAAKNIWGVLFHPELTRERMVERLLMSEGFFTPEQQKKMQEFIDGVVHGGEAQKVGKHFLTHVGLA